MTGKLEVKEDGERFGVLYVPLLGNEDVGETVAVCGNGVSNRQVAKAIKRVNLEQVVPGTPRKLREVVTRILQEDRLLAGDCAS